MKPEGPVVGQEKIIDQPVIEMGWRSLNQPLFTTEAIHSGTVAGAPALQPEGCRFDS